MIFALHCVGKFWGYAFVGGLGSFAGWNSAVSGPILGKTQEEKKDEQAESSHIIRGSAGCRWSCVELSKESFLQIKVSGKGLKVQKKSN